MPSEDLVSREIFASLIRLTEERSPFIAQRVALATLAGAYRALAEIRAGDLDAVALQSLVLRALEGETDDVFAVRH